MNKDASFGIIPFHKDGKNILYLLVQHKKGHWGFPKGHKEKAETDIEAARREFEEETGVKDYKILDISPVENRYEFKFNELRFHKTVKYFIAEVFDTEVTVQVGEIMDHKWADFHETHELLVGNSKKLLEKINRKISSVA